MAPSRVLPPTETGHLESDLAAWRKVADDFSTQMRGAIVPNDMLDLAIKERNAYRAKRAAHFEK